MQFIKMLAVARVLPLCLMGGAFVIYQQLSEKDISNVEQIENALQKALAMCLLMNYEHKIYNKARITYIVSETCSIIQRDI